MWACSQSVQGKYGNPNYLIQCAVKALTSMLDGRGVCFCTKQETVQPTLWFSTMITEGWGLVTFEVNLIFLRGALLIWNPVQSGELAVASTVAKKDNFLLGWPSDCG